jgi:hypothetical protein
MLVDLNTSYLGKVTTSRGVLVPKFVPALSQSDEVCHQYIFGSRWKLESGKYDNVGSRIEALHQKSHQPKYRTVNYVCYRLLTSLH